MQTKRLNLKEWAKQVSAEWKHIPSLKGKQTERHLFILKSLTLAAPNGISAWDLALQYLKETEEKFSVWPGDTVYHQRQIENAKMNRRLRFLEEKGYVHKVGSLYQVTGKGGFLLFALDPSIIQNLAPRKANMLLFESAEKSLKEDHKFLLKACKEAELLDQNNTWQLKDFFSDDVRRKTFGFFLRETLRKWKVNLDEISTGDLIELVVTRATKAVKKKHRNVKRLYRL